MKVRITFSEVVSYETAIDVEPTAEFAKELAEHAECGDPLDVVVRDLLEDPAEDGEPLWFHILEKQQPGWSKTRLAGVEDRELRTCKVVR